MMHGLSAVKFESFFSWTTINVQEVTRANCPRNGSERIYVNTSLLKELSTCGTVLMNKLLVLAVSTILSNLQRFGSHMKMGLSWNTCVR